MERVPFSSLPTPSTPTQTSPSDTQTIMRMEGVPIDMMRFFSVDPRELSNQEKDRINEIYSFASDSVEEKTPGNIMQFLKQVDYKLGTHFKTDNRIEKIHSYIRIQRQIKDLVKQGQALEL